MGLLAGVEHPTGFAATDVRLVFPDARIIHGWEADAAQDSRKLLVHLTAEDNDRFRGISVSSNRAAFFELEVDGTVIWRAHTTVMKPSHTEQFAAGIRVDPADDVKLYGTNRSDQGAGDLAGTLVAGDA